MIIRHGLGGRLFFRNVKNGTPPRPERKNIEEPPRGGYDRRSKLQGSTGRGRKQFFSNGKNVTQILHTNRHKNVHEKTEIAANAH